MASKRSSDQSDPNSENMRFKRPAKSAQSTHDDSFSTPALAQAFSQVTVSSGYATASSSASGNCPTPQQPDPSLERVSIRNLLSADIESIQKKPDTSSSDSRPPVRQTVQEQPTQGRAPAETMRPTERDANAYRSGLDRTNRATSSDSLSIPITLQAATSQQPRPPQQVSQTSSQQHGTTDYRKAPQSVPSQNQQDTAETNAYAMSESKPQHRWVPIQPQVEPSAQAVGSSAHGMSPYQSQQRWKTILPRPESSAHAMPEDQSRQKEVHIQPRTSDSQPLPKEARRPDIPSGWNIFWSEITYRFYYVKDREKNTKMTIQWDQPVDPGCDPIATKPRNHAVHTIPKPVKAGYCDTWEPGKFGREPACKACKGNQAHKCNREPRCNRCQKNGWVCED
ncbi:hypothetical protein K491DRAFT_694426 [Lophiostoma macrostomum CBS 122681]|uniref:Uncharacterized protein n=1 Tax=Lophiostoma macrostomum CBS 122681 TaxID=1314788 RepID=A0A6A6T5G6_9PLEO|nr:hypothetical protein K491DRAFT_694426 [Lophiostoma macrostomum CBS 122681]